jgi:hypothetical protein
MTERNRDLRGCYTAYDCRDRLPDLARWLPDDDLKVIPIWQGARLEPGQAYVDLDNLARGPFVATGDEGQVTDHTYAARRDMPLRVWERLASAGPAQPTTRTTGRDVGPPQSPAGPARLS